MSRRFNDTEAAAEIIREIKNGDYSKAIAYGLLKQIINDLPGTSVASEAQSLLNDM